MALLISGILNFGAISIFSRLLSPAEYGAMALALASSALSIAFLYQWVMHSFIRFLPQKSADENKLYLANFAAILAIVSISFIGLALVAYGLNAGLGHIFSSLPIWIWILVPAAAISETLFTVISHYTRLVRENIRLYAIATILRSFIYIGIGYALVKAGYGFYGVLTGVVLSFLLPGLFLVLGDSDWRRMSKEHVKKIVVREIIAFGFPIIAVTSIQTAIASTDNFLLTLFMGPAATGQFAVALDLVTKSLIFLMIIIHRTTYPLVVKKLEHEGIESAQHQYKHNVVLLMSLSIPACAGLALLSKNIVGILLGPEFQTVAGQIIPFLTLVSFLNCAFQFYLTPAFHLAKKTHLMIAPVVLAFMVNLGVSSLCIPSFGINGAIIGSFCAYLTCFGLSLFFVKRVFPLPFPLKDFLKISCATVVMTAAIWNFRGDETVLTLLLSIALGGFVYFTMFGAMNVGGYRTFALNTFKKKYGR